MELIEPEIGPDIAAYFDFDGMGSLKARRRSLDQVRRALSGSRGSLSDADIALREEGFQSDRPSQRIVIP